MNELSYRDILEEEFSFRVKQNPSYSLRAFARDLEINPSQLVEIRKKNIGLSSKKSLCVAKKLGLSNDEARYFQALVDSEHGRSQQIKDLANTYLEAHRYSHKQTPIDMNHFKLIADWYHYAILSTMELDDYDGDITWIASYLNLELNIVQDAVKRLIKLDLVDFQDGKLVVSNIALTTSHDLTSLALKTHHRQHLNKAINAINAVPLEERDITSMTLTIDKDRIPEAKDLIKKFRREFCRIMEESKKNEVYNLNIQFVPIKEIQ